MKNLLFLLVLTVSINTTKAQDATLKETIDWLNIYGLKENGTSYSNPDITYTNTWYLTKKNEKLHFELKNFKNGIELLKERSRFFYEDINWILLSQIDQHFTVTIDCKETENQFDQYYLSFLNKESAISLFRALKHLNTFYNHKIQFIDKIRPDLKNKF